MDRVIVYPGAVPMDTDLLRAGVYAKTGLGALSDMVYGPGVMAARGLSCTPSGSGMSVAIGVGSIVAPGVVDETLFGGAGGGLQPDQTPIGCQYLNMQVQNVPVPVSGATVTVFAVCAEQDVDPGILPFYNASNPGQTQAGADNGGAALPTCRSGTISFVVGTSEPSAPAGGVVVALYSLSVPANASNLSGVVPQPGQVFWPTIPQLATQAMVAANESSLQAMVQSSGATLQAMIQANDSTLQAAMQANTSMLQSSIGSVQSSITPLSVMSGNGSLTVPSWASRVELRAIGGGGGGSTSNATSAANGSFSGSGGGAGGDAWGVYSVSPGGGLTVTIGGGGGQQDTGGTTLVSYNGSTLLQANGGAGGYFYSSQGSAGGKGGTASGGTNWNLTGGYGSDGQCNTSTFSGNGGDGPFGGGGRAGNLGGSSATAWGAGGGGAYSATSAGTQSPGGNGFQGCVLYRFLP